MSLLLFLSLTFAVEDADVVIQDAVSVAAEKSAEKLRSHVAPRGRKSAEIVEAHQLAQRQRVLDKLVPERHVFGILDRKGQFVFAQLEIQLVERPVTQICVHDLRRREFDLNAVVEFGSDVARQAQAHALDKEGGRVIAPFVAGLEVSRNRRQGGQHLVPCGRFGLERRDLCGKLPDRSRAERIGLLGIGGAKQPERQQNW